MLGLPAYGLLLVLEPTGALASALGLGWFGGSLLVTALILLRVLRAINARLRRGNLPTLY